jgi:hypothetical protein
MTDGITVKGGDELRRTMGQVATDLADLTDVNNRGGDLLLAASRAKAPKKSGRLAGSLRTVAGAAGFTVTSPLVYAGPIHWGWRERNIWPTYFLYDALDVKRAAILEAYATEVDDAIAKVHGA